MPKLFPLACVALVTACQSSGSHETDDLGHADARLPEGTDRIAIEDPPAAGATAVRLAELTFVQQPGWIATTPASDMRVVQYVLPRTAGDAVDAELVVYHFGDDGGTVEQNIERWCGQFEQPDGRRSADVAEVSKRQVGAATATVVALSGTYVGETFPGSGEHFRDAGRALRAAIVPTSAGRAYVKLLGPTRTVRAWDASWQAFLDALDD